MLRLSFVILAIPLFYCRGFAQSESRDRRVFTSDIDHFWIAYDSAMTTADSVQQLHYIETLYVDKGTPGLKAFMEVRSYSAAGWVSLLRKYPKFWKSIRPNTLSVKSFTPAIEASIRRFKKLYPSLSNAKMYFTVGGLRSGGTTKDSMILIGTEIATGGPETDVSEFRTKWLAGVFQNQRIDNIVPLNIHEFVHTQQHEGEIDDLLGVSLQEGSADFITELVMGKPRETNYIIYGRAHEPELKKNFTAEMFSGATIGRWLYNGDNAKDMADLGYFMGYAICASYYRQATDKQQAISDIIQLDYSDTAATEKFLKRSGYITDPYDKTALLASLSKKLPIVTGMAPFVNGDSAVDPSLTELTIRFSMPMQPGQYSISKGATDADYPIAKVTGFAADNRSITLRITLQPGHDYEFICTGMGFRSADGYALQPYKVHFRTSPK
ncbi:MAG TPA: Ig-like domain-containing protein [Puia sp.]|jgi:hypothetical protein|nr:Ig-like domain-containing protein [Puia sp.]